MKFLLNMSVVVLLLIPSVAFGKNYFISPDVVMDGNKLSVTGKTNLPNGTYISIFIIGKSLPFTAQGNTVVSNHAFISKNYGPDAGLKDGSYSVEVSATKPEFKNMPLEKVLDDKNSEILAVKNFSVTGGRIGKFKKEALPSLNT